MKAADYNLIERYFNKELSENETAEVLEKCAKDRLFAAAFERQKLLLEVVDENYENKLRTLLKTKEAEISNQIAIEKSTIIVKKSNYKKWFSIAASILVLVIAAYFLMNYYEEDEPNQAEVFAQNFEPYRNFLVPIERGNLSENILEQTFQYYENENYQNAINGFEELLKDSISADILFYKGVAELAEAKTEKAIQSFEKAINLNTQFEAAANWYLILGNLKLEKMEVVEKLKQQFLEDFPTSEYVEKVEEF